MFTEVRIATGLGPTRDKTASVEVLYLRCYSKRVVHVVVAAGLLSRYLNGALPCVLRHITVLKCVECVVN